jgi:predicted DNA-binding protein YlxM (UPF0122 family)
LRKFYFKFLRLLNRGEPSVTEVQYVLLGKYRLTDDMSPTKKRTSLILCWYSIGESLDDIAKRYNVPRERIRQIIRKACR